MSERTILIATGNTGKLREIRAVMDDLPVVWETLQTFPEIDEPVEDGATFFENAAIKARYYSRRTGLWALADDSGLVVDALGGAPGVHSSRYAGQERDEAANCRKLVEALRGIPAEQRSARFVCSIVCVDGDEVLAHAEGRFEGMIVDEGRGENGFGYDPHFWVPSREMTSAELSPSDKNAMSHRGAALAAIRPELLRVLGG